MGPHASDPPVEPHSHDPPGPLRPRPSSSRSCRVENQLLLLASTISSLPKRPKPPTSQPQPAPFSFQPRCSCSPARCLLLAIVSGLQSAGRLSACSCRRCSFARSPSQVPRVELPDELFVNIAVAIGAQVNKFLCFLQDVSCERNLKHFVVAIAGLWAAAVIGSWCNFLTVIYIGFVCVHTLPVLYEKYEDQVDDFLYSLLGLLRDQYQKLDQGVLSKIPKGNMKAKKNE
ncbi:reticulon-like protein B8 isoform X1 [Miscanthus floridulus]|uniref:reticulon-like protein B8 isoform X1 n=1 Tax=Miscanthus floridulus TaxID=154761 RepID=UPI00345950C9